MFVRKKTTKSGTTKHYLVESRREGGKVRQKVLAYLGEHPTAEARLAWLDEEVERLCRDGLRWAAEPDTDDLKTRLRYSLNGPPHHVRQMLDFLDREIRWHMAEAARLREIICSAQ
jgi:hypothetical protein